MEKNLKNDTKISGKLLDINTHRKVAKVGMGVTLATVCLTALCMNGRGMKNYTQFQALHLLALLFIMLDFMIMESLKK